MIKISQYDFEGPFSSTNELENSSGVYVILGRNDSNNWNVVDVGESEDVKTRVQNHDRKSCWERTGYSSLAVAASYTNEYNRVKLERELRGFFNPSCGKR